MTLIEALNKFPGRLIMLDMLELDKSKRAKPVEQIKTEQQEFWKRNEYVVRTHDSLYGKPNRKAIGLKNGPNIYIEANTFDLGNSEEQG